MKQKQYAPLSVAEMAVSLCAVNEGLLDDVEVTKVVGFEEAMLAHIRSNNQALLDKINEDPSYSDEIVAELKAAIEDFKANGVY